MLTRSEVIEFCKELSGAYEDYPFEDNNWTIMRHQGNKKMFAAIYERQGHIWINAKAEPEAGYLWRSIYSAVIPAYHMNKVHWISIILDGSMAREDICRLIEDSHALTAPKVRKRRKSDDNEQ